MNPTYIKSIKDFYLKAKHRNGIHVIQMNITLLKFYNITQGVNTIKFRVYSPHFYPMKTIF